jgi:integrase
MSVFKRGAGPYYYYEFIFEGKRVRESAKTTSKTLAREAERLRRRELEKILAGVPVERRDTRIRSVADSIAKYLVAFEVNHRTKTTVNVKTRLAHVKRLLGSTLIPDLSEDQLKRYIQVRLEEGVCGRTINMEIADLSRTLGKHWSVIWPQLRKMEERQDVGQALAADDESRLLAQLGSTKSKVGEVFVRVALFTGMRYGEILGLTWAQADLCRRVITVGKAKSAAGTGRQIPMNNDLAVLLTAHAQWFQVQFGEAKPQWFLFPFGSPKPQDPSRPATTIRTYWETVRARAGLDCRFHDLRHTVATKMAEAGVPESTMLALMGHMSRKMLERYSHIRMAAKREAVESLSTQAKSSAVPPKSPPFLIAERLN